jgi:hypothetical protein
MVEQFFQNNLKKLGLAQIVADVEEGLLVKPGEDGHAQPEVGYNSRATPLVCMLTNALILPGSSSETQRIWKSQRTCCSALCRLFLLAADQQGGAGEHGP